MSQTKLIIFVKAPRLGTVKTRLAKDIGNAEALAAYRHLVQRVVENVGSMQNVELRFTPDDASEEVRSWLQNTWEAVPQRAGDLGDRMQRAFEEALEQGCEKVVVIGSDCPTISEADIQQALNALCDHDLTLGPSPDGGYWLVGMKRVYLELFQNMTWSIDSVLGETLERAEKLGLKYKLLSEKTDIDDVDSWESYQQTRGN